MRKLSVLIIVLLLSFSIYGCGSSDNQNRNDTSLSEDKEITDQEEDSELSGDEGKENELELLINDTVIPVKWENNDTVKELKNEASKGEIVVEMSMYSDNEQVGSLGRSYTRNDRQTTTHNGDIVLYSGSNIVLFYGSNSWAYTRLGKIDLSEAEVTELLSNGDVTVTLR